MSPLRPKLPASARRVILLVDCSISTIERRLERVRSRFGTGRGCYGRVTACGVDLGSSISVYLGRDMCDILRWRLSVMTRNDFRSTGIPLFTLLASAILGACSGGSSDGPKLDAGGKSDVGGLDVATSDSLPAVKDSLGIDTGRLDGIPIDSGATDVATDETGSADGLLADTSRPDSGVDGTASIDGAGGVAGAGDSLDRAAREAADQGAPGGSVAVVEPWKSSTALPRVGMHRQVPLRWL